MSTTVPSGIASDPAVPRSAWLALSVTTVVFFLTVVDVSAVNVAFPSIGDDFGVSKSQLSWIISGYNITVASGLLLAGRMADSIGRKRVFMPGVVIFMVGSLLSGLAPSVAMLIGARVIQAVGGAIVAAASLAVVLPEFPLSKRGTVIGIAGATAGLGAVAGPALGSVLIEAWSWRAIFLINVPLCLLVLALSPRLLRESKDPNATGKVDLLGIPIGTAAIALIMFAIVQSESWGLSDPRIVALLIVGLALVPVLIWRSARHPEPLIDLSLFGIRSFASAIGGVTFYSSAFTAGFLVSSLTLQDLWDQSLRVTGLALVPGPILAAVASPLAGRYADRFGHRWLLGFGSAICGLAYLLYLLLLDETPAVFTRFVPISLVLGIGIGLSISSWSSAGMADIPPAKFGTANATVRTVQQCFYALGIAVVVTLLATGGERSELTGFRWAWIWVGGAYLASAAVIMLTFPAGSSQDRSAPARSGSNPDS
ncbi:MAG: MFS transporter [Acidimicrobiales bacterium]